MGRKATYGRGHANFLEYVKRIVQHKAYAGMPDVFKDDGEVQWEAPSNRQSGKHRHTHQRRLDWWRAKARSIGINPETTPEWISRTAKAIHPFKEKPCKNCGRSLELAYAYPGKTLATRVAKLTYLPARFQVDPTEHIADLVERMHSRAGNRLLDDLPQLLEAKGAPVPRRLKSIEAWLGWIRKTYVPAEPRILSPGVMSNPPDRFDGFHSFNRCCRSTSDRGRSKENLQSYSTDRRAFEYWVSGNWIAADRLMGFIRSNKEIKKHNCLNGHDGPCDADHLGPVSLGFAHREEFQLLCGRCNSAKSNRLTLSDIQHLRRRRLNRETVCTWYCEDLFDLLSDRATTTETTRRLGKMMRDNRHTASVVLGKVCSAGHLTFLCGYLGLPFAEHEINFTGYRVVSHLVTFEGVTYPARKTKYVDEQQARRIRVAFASLREYLEKPQRNAVAVLTHRGEELVEQAVKLLTRTRSASIKNLDERLAKALESRGEELLRSVSRDLPNWSKEPADFRKAREMLRQAFRDAASELAGQWTDPRYIREEGIAW
jgi:Alw26I/Eco31I/Esp3I family type II restriction endonuclease